MSHHPERKEKDCLNCGAQVAGRFCQVCGQENKVPKQTVWGLVSHFVSDIFHFDGKFFVTLKYLLVKPGLIPKEYINGRRKRFLEPIRMYLFTSAVFFLMFFKLNDSSGVGKFNDEEEDRLMTRLERYNYASAIHNKVDRSKDTNLKRQLDLVLDSNYSIYLRDTSRHISKDSGFLIDYKGMPYYMLHKKDNTASIKITSTNNWLGKKLDTKWRAYKEKYGDDSKSMLRDALSTFLHQLPYILFVSLPFFALILKLLYIRRKSFYYSDHAIFTLYHYILTFIALMVFFLLNELSKLIQFWPLRLLVALIFLAPGVYLFLAMKRFYAQGTGKTVLKFLLLNFLGFLVVMSILIVFVIFSIITL